MNKEELNNKLNMIFEELLEIHEKLMEQDMEKQRLKAKDSRTLFSVFSTPNWKLSSKSST